MTTMTGLPWQHPELEGWAIVGMNHYIHEDRMYLFVAMVSGRYCIKAEGPDNLRIWAELREQALELDELLSEVPSPDAAGRP